MKLLKEVPIRTQPTHDVITTLLQRHFNVLKSVQRPYDVVLTSVPAGYTMFTCSKVSDRFKNP